MIRSTLVQRIILILFRTLAIMGKVAFVKSSDYVKR